MQQWMAELYEHYSPTTLHKFLRFVFTAHYAFQTHPHHVCYKLQLNFLQNPQLFLSNV